MVLEYLPTNWDYLENYINGVNVGVHIPAPWILWEWYIHNYPYLLGPMNQRT